MTAQAKPQSNFKALDLTREYPRSPRATLGGYVLAARMLDKCRAVIAGTQGEYHYNCPLDRNFLDFTGVDADEFRNFVAAGASDDQVDQWIREKTRHISDEDRAAWNFRLRERKVSELEPAKQAYMDSILDQCGAGAAGKRITVLFDIFDADEKRL